MNPSSKLRALSVSAILAAISAFPAHAILDTNNNGLSDLWEKQHNNGNLFPNTFLATHDEDQDGWTNAKEAIAGTDPFNPNPPDGIVAVEITPSLVPGAFTLTWPTLIGKNYQLQVSTDLVTWNNVGTAILSFQNSNLSIGINVLQPDNTIPQKLFWKVSVEDRDEDDDRLTAAEEYALGLDDFNGQNIPGIPDFLLALNFIDDLISDGISGIHLEADNDGDGRTNREELLDETNPNVNDTPTEKQWVVVVGDKAMGVASTRTKQLFIPAGKTVLLAVAIASEEYTNGFTVPDETDQYNDLLTWNVEPTGQQAITGQININDKHEDLILAETNFQKLWGLPGPIHYEIVKVITAPIGEGMTIDVEMSATNIADGILPSYVAVGILPIELKVTDFATKYDNLPYFAISNALPPKNSELCLKADQSNEKAKIEISHPSIIDDPLLSKLKWKVVNTLTESTVEEGEFTTTTTPEVDLSLANEGSVEDEILFEVHIGANDGTFTPAAKIKVVVVRDRLCWWFEPFSPDFGWRTSNPEPRENTGDYKRKQIINAAGKLEWVPDPTNALHHHNAYRRESLQSVYDFLKSPVAIGPNTPKENWVPPPITCFGEFHEALKSANDNNTLVDLTTLARIDLTTVTILQSFETSYGALRSVLAKQTTYSADDNPTLRASQFPERVQFAEAAVTAVGNANLSRARLMALWTREGSMDVSSQHTRTGYHTWPIGFNAAITSAPSSEDDAKTIFIYDVAYICLGSDFLLKHSGGADNQPDLRDYVAALDHFKITADATGGAGISDRILSNLTVAGTPGSYTVSANGGFYEDMLTLAGKHFISVWQAEGPEATYMAYNMGIAKFNQMKATLGGITYPERGRLGLINWAIHYEIRNDEWDQPRDFAQKFHAYRMAFEAKYP